MTFKIFSMSFVVFIIYELHLHIPALLTDNSRLDSDGGMTKYKYILSTHPRSK